MTSHSRSWSEIYREAGDDWADKEAAAQLLEDTKSAVFSQWCMEQGDIPVNKAEQIVKASPRWKAYIEQIIETRKQANKAKVRLDSIKMRAMEWQAKEATARVEARLG